MNLCVAQPGRVLGLEPSGRRFKSYHTDHAPLPQLAEGAALEAECSQFESEEAHQNSRAWRNWQTHLPQKQRDDGSNPSARTNGSVSRAGLAATALKTEGPEMGV